MRPLRADAGGEPLQGGDLVHDVGRQVGRLLVDEPAAEPVEVVVGDVRADAHAVRGRV